MKNLSSIAKQLGSRGGNKRAKKYGKKQLSEWGRLGGRPKKGEESKNSITKKTGIKNGSRDRNRELVRIQDNYTCQICGKAWLEGNRKFDVHHIDEQIEGKSKISGICEYDRKNIALMTTLCHRCHMNLDSVKKKMGPKVDNLNITENPNEIGGLQ